MERYIKKFKEVKEHSIMQSMKDEEESLNRKYKFNLKRLKLIESEINHLNEFLDKNFHNENKIMGEISLLIIQIEKSLDNKVINELKKHFNTLLQQYNFQSVESNSRGQSFTNFSYIIKDSIM